MTPRAYQYRPSADRLGNAEEWRNIPSVPNYKASNLGRLMGPSGNIKSSYTDKYGYEVYGVYVGGKLFNKKCHRLVCEAFHGPEPVGKPLVAHIDGDRSNNRPCNLMWATALENYDHMRLHGTEITGEKHHWAKLTREQVREIWLSSMSKRKMAAKYNVSAGSISGIRTGRCWSAFTQTLPPQPFRAAKTKIPPPSELRDWRGEGLSAAKIAARCGVNKTTVLRWIKNGGTGE